MRILGVLLAVLLVLPANAFAEGNATGNGGGVICIAGKCQTLVESGLRLAPDFNGVWLPSSEHYSNVEKFITDRLHLPRDVKNDVYVKIFGRADHFRRVEVVDAKKLDAIKDLYLNVASEAGFPIDPNTFKVVAFSSDDTVKPAMTYLLPEFFTLDSKSQNSILIHEGLYRGRPTNNLKLVLQLESSMELLSGGLSNCTDMTKVAKFRETCMNQPMIAYQLGLGSKSALIDTLFRLAMIGGGRQFSAILDPDLFGTMTGEGPVYLQLDPRKLLALGKADGRIPYIFSRVQFLKFEFVEKTNEYDNKSGLSTDWTSDGRMHYASCKWLGSQRYECNQYKAVDDGQLELVLPE